MNFNKLYQYKVIDRPKSCLLKYCYFLLLLTFCVICLVFHIVDDPRSLLAEKRIRPKNESSNEKFERLVDCLTSTGVAVANIIKRNNETNYTEMNWQWNTVNGYLEPMAYLVANDVLDVQNAVICCQQSKIRVVPRGGGHSFVKYGFGDLNSLVIDFKNLNKISIDPIQMNCEIGAGARVALITYTLWKEGEFMIPLGVCPTVGIAGLALGGGYGYYTRLLGLSSDNLLELEMVDATGKVLVINNSTNEDLYWALRGGGGGSFGIVTKLKFQMYSTPKYILYGIYQYQFDDFPKYFEAWQNLITSNLPNDIGILSNVCSNIIEMQIFKIYFQSDKQVYFDDLLDSFSFPQATISSNRNMSYYDFMLTINQRFSSNKMHDLSELVNITKHRYKGMSKVKSIYVDTILDKNKISKLQILLKAYLKLAKIKIELNTGAINNLNCSDTAFVHRGKNVYHIQLKVYSDENEEINREGISEMNRFYDASKDIFNHRESYQNYIDEDIPDYLERYYGTNLNRLIQVKMRIDPENVFHHPQSIPVSLY